MRQSEKIEELLKALNAAREEFTTINKETKAYNYKYADISTIMDSIGEPLNKNGLAIFHQTDWTSEIPVNVSTLMHMSGQFITCSVRLDYKPDGKVNAMQAMGSALTYARRYALYQLLNLVSEDDDGASSGPKGVSVTKPKEEKTVAAPSNFISEYQAAELGERLKKIDRLDYVLNYYGISSLKDMFKSDFPSVLQSLAKMESMENGI